MVYALKYDCKHRGGREISVRQSSTGGLIVDGRHVMVLDNRDATKVPWDALGVNVVIETVREKFKKVVWLFLAVFSS